MTRTRRRRCTSCQPRGQPPAAVRAGMRRKCLCIRGGAPSTPGRSIMMMTIIIMIMTMLIISSNNIIMIIMRVGCTRSSGWRRRARTRSSWSRFAPNDTAFPCACAAVLPTADAFACGAAAGRDRGAQQAVRRADRTVRDRAGRRAPTREQPGGDQQHPTALSRAVSLPFLDLFTAFP